ncbi:hypothetical protein PtB15_4B292 [Puccinia triticina]|nr:hypothetical protein PtB15_4B292 [Puccinia triticina]
MACSKRRPRREITSQSSSSLVTLDKHIEHPTDQWRLCLTGLDAIEALEFLMETLQDALDQKSGQSKTNLTLDDLGPKIEYWDGMTTSILPRIKEQTNSLSLSLDLHDSTRHPNPNFESTIDLLFNLNITLDAAIAVIGYIALQSPLPAETHDHNLGPCKQFRCSYLLQRIKALVKRDLCTLYRASIQFIRAWECSSNDPDDSEYQANTINEKNEVLKLTAHSRHLIDKIIDLIPKSDLRFLQATWLMEAEALGPVLEILTNLTNLTIPKSKLELEPPDYYYYADVGKRRARAVVIARSTITLIKLTRTLLKRASTAETNKMPFSLDVKLNSKRLEQLRLGPTSIAQLLGVFVRALEESALDENPRPNTVNSYENVIRIAFNEFTKDLDSFLHDLDRFSIPLTPSISNSQSETEFIAWTRVLEDMWRKAIHLHLDVILPEITNRQSIEHQQ